jgi:hypothetical protein
MRRDGTSNPELRSAARTRSRASSTALPARPTIVRPGRPKATSTSTRTGTPSTPTTEALSAVASMGRSSTEAIAPWAVPVARLLASLLTSGDRRSQAYRAPITGGLGIAYRGLTTTGQGCIR